MFLKFSHDANEENIHHLPVDVEITRSNIYIFGIDPDKYMQPIRFFDFAVE